MEVKLKLDFLFYLWYNVKKKNKRKDYGTIFQCSVNLDYYFLLV